PRVHPSSCSGDPGDLHSFPPRRSSDLPLAAWRAATVSAMRPAGSRTLAAVGASLYSEYSTTSIVPKGLRHVCGFRGWVATPWGRSEEHTSELQSRGHPGGRLLRENNRC